MMLNRLLAIAFLFNTAISQGQITETNTSSVPTVIGKFTVPHGSQGSLIQKIKDADTTYILEFKNYTDKDMHQVVFNEKGGALNTLYNILASFFYSGNKKNKDYKRTFKLGDEDITCTYEKTATSVVFSTNKGYFLINEKQLNRLFGK